MAELTQTPATVVTAVAAPAAIDAAVTGWRIAPDELMVIGPPDEGETLTARVAEGIRAVDGDALILDASDGWDVWALVGQDARALLSYLSALELPDEGFVQGDVARLPVRIVAEADSLTLLVPAPWGAHLERRVRERL